MVRLSRQGPFRRRAGVSPNAPHRHYPDKDALLAAMATQGFHDLRGALLGVQASSQLT